ncbi:MAG: hypothetical protein EBY22_03045 [Gammaproteobacteria bacterium]|nr:hypothetical protein [Gammaproteobacteria bacterium]
MHTESYVYLLTNKHNNVLYTGVTTDLIRRIYESIQRTVSFPRRRESILMLV